MKVLFFSDVHGPDQELYDLKEKAVNVDVVVCAGDFTMIGTNLEKRMSIINNFSKPVILIHGNHEDETLVEILSEKFENIHYLHSSFTKHGEFYFLGHGGGGFGGFDPKLEKFMNEYNLNPERNEKTIFIFHGPPYGYEVDYIYGASRGTPHYSEIIRKARPKLVVCGHLHETAGFDKTIDGTRIINPGPKGMILDI